MAFSFGIISALVAARKKRGQSRLQQLLTKGKRQGRTQVKLYQFSTKILFSICFLLLLSFCMEWFRSQIHIQLATQEVNQLIPPESSFAIIQSSSQTIAQLPQKSREFDLEKLNNTINTIHFVIFATIIFLALNLQMRIVKCFKHDKSINSVVYKYFCLKQVKESYNVKQLDKIFIWQMGESRFSNTNYYFSIRIGAEASWEVIRKSSIYDSRAAAIKIATALDLQFSTRIVKVGPEDSFRSQQ